MARTRHLQTNFSAGELSPALAFRRDTAQYNAGAKKLRNCRLLVSGGFTRRPGSRYLREVTGPCRLEEWTAPGGVNYLALFTAGQFDAILPDGTLAGVVTGAPWTGDIWRTMRIEQQADAAFITHPSMPPQILRRTGATTWSVEPFAFSVSGTGAIRQPYYKLAPAAVTLQPSALTGSVTLTLSAPWFTADHVGARVRYAGREIVITGWNSGLEATGTVIEDLPPTADIEVEDATGFYVGDQMQGPDSGARGVIVGVSGTTVTVVQITLESPFIVDEVAVSNRGQSKVVAVTTASEPGALLEWDEALFTPQWGYPRCVALHRNRLCFGGHPTVGNALIASQIDAFDNFDVGTGGDAEAIFAFIGDGVASSISHFVSTEQLLLLTDRGPYYVPEGPQNPFRPTSIDFQRFGSKWPAADARPQLFDDGVLMVSGSLAIMLRPTGNASNRQWEAEEVSLLSSHLIARPTDTCVTENYGGGPERYVIMVNEGGSLVAAQIVQAQEIRNFTPWDTNGTYVSVAAIAGDIFAVVQRTLRNTSVYVLERFDQSLTLDAATTYDDLDDVAARYGDAPVLVVDGTYSLGPLPVEYPPDGPADVGLDYTLEAETFPPFLDGVAGGGAGVSMRLNEVFVHVLSSARFALQGQVLTAYQLSDDVLAPPPLRTEPMRFKLLGWRRDPTLMITQADPLPLTVLGLSMEVSF